MKILYPVACLLLLCGCDSTTRGTEHLQVAPNPVDCDLGTPGGQTSCLAVRSDITGEFGPWLVADINLIKGFVYEPGYLYDLTVDTSCTRGLGEFFPLYRTLQKVNSKEVSKTVITAETAYQFGIFC
ncbi:DUF4377 domain-containing protein [Deinococcus ruber]|uniref:DUF4377 domain-containing protein n=1 Tax=Deinococcus ruber TaxID=1848197 RepID=UPI00166461BF